MLKKRTFLRLIMHLICGAIFSNSLNSAVYADYFIVGKVVGIADGDTLTMLDEFNKQHKIRLAGIDAPEKGQPFGQKSKESLSQQAFDKLVKADCTKTDRYRREICVVWVDGQDANLRQIQAGLAWHYKKYEREQTFQQREDYSNAEDIARSSGIGLWSELDPIAPWNWRNRKFR